MSHTLTIEVPDAFAEAWRSLRPASQDTLVQFARFLKAQEAETAFETVDEADEAAWDVLFQDEQKVAAFSRWADASLSRSPAMLLDPACL